MFPSRLFILLSLLVFPVAAQAGIGGPVSPKPYVVFDLFGFPVTNAMVTTWVISIALVVVIRLMIGRVGLIPSNGQAVVETVVEALRGALEPVVGKRMIGKTFPILIAFFTIILINNWSGLLPGVGTFGHWEASGSPLTVAEAATYQEQGVQVVEKNGEVFKAKLIYYFRPGNASLSNTAALAVVSFFAWLWFIFRYAGPKAILYDLFGNKANRKEVPGAMYLFLAVIFILVGFIEIISIIFRPVSLSFRLFGNVFGGENLLSNMHGLVAYLLPVPFYFLEVLIGLIQAFVFTLLVAVYIGLICNHEGGEHEHEHEEDAHA